MNAGSLILELKRRRVFRVVIGYGLVAFAILQVIEPVMHGLHLPDATLTYVVLALAVGFPVAVVLAWAFDVNEGRLERAAPVPSAGLSGLRLRLTLVGIGLVAAAPGVLWYFVWPGHARPRGEATAVAGRPSIAVLPFADMSPGKDQEYFSDGIAEQILDNLAQVAGLKVIGRTSSFSFKGKSDDLRTIGEKLGVAHILEGSVRKAGDRIRITTQLVNARDGSHLWSETYDRKLTDVFAVQDEIAKAAVQALQVRLLPGALKSTSSAPRDPEAYRLYLLGRSLLLLESEDGARRATAALEKSIALDATYAPAWERLATARGNAALVAPQAEVERRFLDAVDAVERAIALEPDYYAGYAVRGWLRSGRWDWAGAQKDMERAVALGPNTLITFHYGAIVLGRTGRLKEAIALQRKAAELEPLGSFVWGNLGGFLLQDGQLDEARGAYEKALENSPQNKSAHRQLALIDLLQGHAAEALAAMDKLPREADRLLGIAIAQHALGHTRESQDALDRLVARGQQESDLAYRVASIHAWRGDRDAAFEWLDRAYVRREPGLRLVKVDPLVRNLRSDARYTALLKKMNLPLD